MKKIKVGHDLVSFKENSIPPSIRHGQKIMHPKEFQFWQKSSFCPFFYWQCWSLKESLYKLNMKLGYAEKLIFTQLYTALDQFFSKTKKSTYTHKALGLYLYISVEVTTEYIQTFATNDLHFRKMKIFISDQCNNLNQKSVVRNLVTKNIKSSSLIFESWNNRASFPTLLIEGKKREDLDVSLSHDGNFASACILAGRSI